MGALAQRGKLLHDTILLLPKIVVTALLVLAIGDMLGLAAWFGTRLAITNSMLTSPALQINLGWVYAAVSLGGVLIAIYGLGLALAGPNTADVEQDAVAIAAGD